LFLAKLILLVIIETDILFKSKTPLSFNTLWIGVFVDTTEGLNDMPIKPLEEAILINDSIDKNDFSLLLDNSAILDDRDNFILDTMYIKSYQTIDLKELINNKINF